MKVTVVSISVGLVLLAQSASAIFFLNDTLEGRAFCDFCRKNCQWQGADKWEWHVPHSSLEFDGPPLLGSNYDSALIVNYSKPRKSHWADDGNRMLFSPRFTPKSGLSCLRFLYSIRVPTGDYYGLTLTIHRHGFDSVEKLWGRGNTLDDRWVEEEVPIYGSEPFQLKFDANAYSDTGYMGIQAIQLEDGACFQRRKSCDFERNGLCDWTVESATNNFTKTKAGFTKQVLKKDVTSNSQYGMVVAAENLKNGETARMIGPELTEALVDQSMCFEFWAIHTDHPATLRVLRQRPDNNETVMWTSSKLQPANEWKRVQVKMDLDKNYAYGDRFVIEAQSQSDGATISIDEIKFKFVCEAEVACPFQQGICGWVHDNTLSETSWLYGEQNRVVNASRLNENVRTSLKVYDKVRSIGLLYSDFTELAGYGKTIQLASPFVEGKAGCAGLLFTVDEIGRNNKTNFLRIDQVLLDGQRRKVWQFSTSEYSLRQTWRPTQIRVPEADQPYRLVLMAGSDDPSTRIGIEDISFTQAPNACQEVVLPTPTPKPDSIINRTLKRVLADLLRNLRTDSLRIVNLAKILQTDPLNPALNDVVSAIDRALNIAK